MRNVSGKIRIENHNTHFYAHQLLFKSCHVEIMRKKKQYTAGQATDDNMTHAH